uniref:Uncharacterized protein n=1 Tax=Solanum lycopersicum TaxID=4081 RepID=A0A3Q7I351_SOLLC
MTIGTCIFSTQSLNNPLIEILIVLVSFWTCSEYESFIFLQRSIKKLLYREARYYGILDHVRSAKWGLFDGNMARLA